MASSNSLYAIGTGAVVVLLGAAVITATAPEQESPLQPQLVNTGELPLSYSNPFDERQRMKRDQVVSLERRTPLELSNLPADGLMGDGKADEYLEVDLRHGSVSHTPPESIRIAYQPGPTGWAGQYWLTSAGNWGQSAGADLSGYTRISFWARGEHGQERIEFKAGSVDVTREPGIDHKDSFATSLGKVSLTRQWRNYRIDLTNLDLSSVIGAFAWVATSRDNPQGVVFYIDDLRYE